MLSDLQRQKLTRFFNVLDGNGDGQLEAADFERIADRVAEERGWQPGREQTETLRARYRMSWQQLEPHADRGRVSLDRFIEFNNEMMKEPGVFDTTVRALAETTFDTLDSDGDGQVTAEEQRQFYRAYGIDERHADTVFERLDINGDGYITRNELVDIMTQFFYSSDPEAPGNFFFGPYTEPEVRRTKARPR